MPRDVEIAAGQESGLDIAWNMKTCTLVFSLMIRSCSNIFNFVIRNLSRSMFTRLTCFNYLLLLLFFYTASVINSLSFYYYVSSNSVPRECS